MISEKYDDDENLNISYKNKIVESYRIEYNKHFNTKYIDIYQ